MGILPQPRVTKDQSLFPAFLFHYCDVASSQPKGQDNTVGTWPSDTAYIPKHTAGQHLHHISTARVSHLGGRILSPEAHRPVEVGPGAEVVAGVGEGVVGVHLRPRGSQC
jgi:hypothetical protein